jgi:hypothetical protein
MAAGRGGTGRGMHAMATPMQCSLQAAAAAALLPELGH